MPLQHVGAPLFAGLGLGLAAGMAMTAGGPLAALTDLLPVLHSPFELPLALLVIAIAAAFAPKAAKAGSLPADIVPVTLTGDEKKDFVAVFRALNAELLDSIEQYKLPPRTKDYMKRMIDYNVPHGKLTRGLTTISTLRSLKGDAPLSATDYRRAAVLGWAVEWLQAMFLVMDDIMDASETRRGQPCWYLQEDVKLNAINDGLLLEAQIYVLLKKYFGGEEVYVPLLELMHEVTHQTALGQFLDLTTSEGHAGGKVDFSLFSMAVYKDIVVYKTAFYSFYLPIALGMRLAGVTDPALYSHTREICIEMGTMFQVQDDVLDCYGAPERIGKIGTDIKDNKCSWLINTALGGASKSQLRVLEANYAKEDPKCEAKVKAVFKDLKLEAKFAAYEEATYKQLTEKIAATRGMPSTIFTQLLNRIYKRDK